MILQKTFSPRHSEVVFISIDLFGTQSSDIIVVMNKDPDTPIFSIADFGIAGDLLTVLSELISEIKRVLNSRW